MNENETDEDRIFTHSILWQRLDTPGHDACTLFWIGTKGGRLAGIAAFQEAGQQHCQFAYDVRCDAAWRTRSATIHGSIGNTPVALQIEVTPDNRWLLNGADIAEAAGLIDLDLGFTPATNLGFTPATNILSLQRLALAVGEAVTVTTAYLSFPELTLERLEQRYERTGPDTYAYQAPRFGYAAVLTVSAATGFVTDYPRLWAQEAMPQ